MRKINEKDLEGAFLMVILPNKDDRGNLPIIRRHLKSVIRQCQNFAGHHVDIFYSGIFVASKKKGDRKITMDREYRKANADQPFVLELN